MSDSQEPTHLVGQSLSSKVWGGVSYQVTQDFGVLGFRTDWYEYSKFHGFPPGYHIGLDVGTPRGTPVYANQYAMVKQSGMSDSFRPNPVILETMDDPRTSGNEAGYTEIYGHLWSDTVTTGQAVKPGELLGFTGEQTLAGTMTPDGSGPHIHFEVYDRGGNAINPLPLLGAKFTPDPNSGTKLSYPGQGAVDCVRNPAACVSGELGDVAKAVTTVAAKAGILLVGLVLLGIGIYAVANPGKGVGGATRKAGRVGKAVATRGASEVQTRRAAKIKNPSQSQLRTIGKVSRAAMETGASYDQARKAGIRAARKTRAT